jgi:hypothetical protein
MIRGVASVLQAHLDLCPEALELLQRPDSGIYLLQLEIAGRSICSSPEAVRTLLAEAPFQKPHRHRHDYHKPVWNQIVTFTEAGPENGP